MSERKQAELLAALKDLMEANALARDAERAVPRISAGTNVMNSRSPQFDAYCRALKRVDAAEASARAAISKATGA